jgi:hypothetical protein
VILKNNEASKIPEENSKVLPEKILITAELLR